ncbi:transglycosylase domain-containing protein [Bacillus coreaensis]
MNKYKKGTRNWFKIILLLACLIACTWVGLEIKGIHDLLYKKYSVTFYDDKDKKIIKIEQKLIDYDQIKDVLPMIQAVSSKEMENQLNQEGLFATTYSSLFMNEEEEIASYYNHQYFGGGMMGIATAADYLFQKDIQQLETSEWIYLLALVDGKKELVTEETANINTYIKKVNDELLRKKILTTSEVTKVEGEIPTLIQTTNDQPIAEWYSYFDLVLSEAAYVEGVSEQELLKDHIKLYTELDSNLQKKTFDTFQVNENFPESVHVENPIEGSMIVIDHTTGGVKALVGGRNPFGFIQNQATELKRPPASTFKPLVVFAPAMEAGWKASDELKDVPLQLEDFKPKNHDKSYRIKVTLEQAIVQSLNVPSVWLLDQIGLQTGIDYLRKFQLFTYHPLDEYRVALGFLREGTSPYQLAQAYTAFPNEGKMKTGHALKQVEGEHVRFEVESEQREIYTKETAEATLDLLKKVVEEGTAQRAKLPNTITYGKTGTTSYDGWFVGISSKYTAAVWVGTQRQASGLEQEVAGGSAPAEIYKKIMTTDSK